VTGDWAAQLDKIEQDAAKQPPDPRTVAELAAIRTRARLRRISTHEGTNNGGPCPSCGRIMSVRERAEQAACNECCGQVAP
jgi:hypothetical protein